MPPTTHAPSPPDPAAALAVPVPAAGAAPASADAQHAELASTPVAARTLLPDTAALSVDDAPRPWLVQKYGGTSVGKFLPAIAGVIAPSYLATHRVAIVCSARSTGTKAGGTTSLLLAAAEQALAPGTPEHELAASTPALPGANGGANPFGRTPSRVRRGEVAAAAAASLASSVDSLDSEPRRSASDATVDRIRDEHVAAVRALGLAAAPEQTLVDDIEDDCERLRDFLMAAKILEEISPRSRDVILSIGERLSCRIVVGALQAAGVEAELVGLESVVDAAFIEELGARGGAGANTSGGGNEHGLDQAFYDLLAIKMAAKVEAAQGVPVVTGYFGNVPGSLLSQVGRGYTDLCAALVAVGLGAEELQIWKEVDGVFTADPRKVPTARLIPAITPEEASELTYYGSEVIHPFTMEQAIKKRVPIRIKNVERPQGGGTVIFPAPEESGDAAEGAALRQPQTPSVSGASTPWGSMSESFGTAAATAPQPRKLPTAVTIKDDVWVLNVHSNRKTLSHGFFARIFGTLDAHGIVVDLISTSEVHVSMALSSAQANLRRPRALDRVRAELSHVGTVSVLREMAILSLVGTQMRHMVGVAGKMFSTLAEGNINIEMISQGANEINISCVIHQKSALKALNLIHYSVLEVNPSPASRQSGTVGRSFF